MKAIGIYNKISPELQAKIPKFEKPITFKMLNGITNNDPDPIERQKNPTIYPKSNIQMRDKIFDRWARNDSGEIVGGWVDIIVADGWNRNEPTREHLFFPHSHGTVFSGKFTLMPNNAKHHEIYEQLMLTNYNKDSVLGEDRDKSKHPFFAPINVSNESKSIRNDVQAIRQALELTKDMKVKDAREFANAMNWNEYAVEEELLSKVEDFARTKPVEFLKVWNDPAKDFKSLLKEALNLGIASYDIQSGVFKLGTQTITTVLQKDRDNVLEAMGVWFEEAKNGKSVLDSIKKQLKEKKEPAMA